MLALQGAPPGRTEADMWAAELDEGAELFGAFWNAPVDRIAIENQVMHKHAKVRIPNYQEFTQSVQPRQFGHPEVKRTCLWLKNLLPSPGPPDAARAGQMERAVPVFHRHSRSDGRSMAGICRPQP